MIMPGKVESWINDENVKTSLSQHFLRTGEMDEQDEIISFRLINALCPSLLWVEVNTTGWVLDARVFVDDLGNFVAIA